MLRKNRPPGVISDSGRIGAGWNDRGHLLAAEEAVPGLSLLLNSLNPGAGLDLFTQRLKLN